MEAIAAVASFIAIGQAIAALPKIAGALKTFSKAGNELANLAEELERMNAYYEYIKTNIDLFSSKNVPAPQSVPEPPYLRNLRTDLERFIQELRCLAESCSKAKGAGGQLRTSKLKWFRKKEDIIELRDRCRGLRHELESAMTPFLLRVQSNDRTLLLELHAYVVKPSHRLTHTPESNQRSNAPRNRTVRPTTGQSASLGHKLDSPPGLDSSPGLVSPPGLVQHPISRPGPYHSSSSDDLPNRRCSCGCHTGLPTNHIGYWSLAGGISLSYTRKTVSRNGVCQRCSCLQSRPALQIQFRCPLWLWRAVILGSVSFGTTTGLSASLRPAVVIDPSDWIWQYIKYGQPDRFLRMIDRNSLALSDLSSLGETFIERILGYRSGLNPIVGALPLNRLRALEGTTASLNAAWFARCRLYHPHETLSDESTYLLRRIVEIANEDDEEEISRVFELVNHPQRLAQALHQRPDLAHFTGATGETLLHVACRYDKADSTEILLSYGAYKDAQDHDQSTPLCIAIICNSFNCAYLLLDYGCDVNVQNGWGGPLRYAMPNPHPAADGLIQKLLEKGASVTTLYHGGTSLLHILGLNSYNYEIVKSRLETILRFGGGSLIETKDKFGCTPLIRATIEANSATTKLLIEAGARGDAVTNIGLNALHCAAEMANINVIKVLTEARINGIDIRTKDDDGYTPLSFFRDNLLRESPHPHPLWVRPSKEVINAFEVLLRDVRDRTIKSELEKLHTIIAVIKNKNTPQAREELRQLMQVKTDARIEWEAETFRAIELQVKQDMLEPAIESLEEFMEVSRARMDVSPFEEPDVDPCFFDYHSKAHGGTDRDEESGWYTTSDSEDSMRSDEED